MGFRKAMLTVAYEHKDTKDVLVMFADKEEKSMRDDLGVARLLLLMDLDPEVRDELEIFSLGDGGVYIIILEDLTYKDFYVKERAIPRTTVDNGYGE